MSFQEGGGIGGKFEVEKTPQSRKFILDETSGFVV
jgi:hypothetical protein